MSSLFLKKNSFERSKRYKFQQIITIISDFRKLLVVTISTLVTTAFPPSSGTPLLVFASAILSIVVANGQVDHLRDHRVETSLHVVTILLNISQ